MSISKFLIIVAVNGGISMTLTTFWTTISQRREGNVTDCEVLQKLPIT